jgi:MFS family permease
MNQADMPDINNEQRAEDNDNNNNNNDVIRDASMDEAQADEEREIESPSDLNLESTEQGNSTSGTVLRWPILASICFVMGSIAYSYDIPSALHQQFQDFMEDHNKDNFEVNFSLLYTLYSIPNIILPFIGGTIVDEVGPARCLPLFAFFCVLGQGLFAFGTQHQNWRVMLIGRSVYGLGGESGYVACSTILSEWFCGKELALAFGVAMALCKLGSVFNNWISPVVANSLTTPSALWVGLSVNGAGLLLSMFILYIDNRYKARPIQSATINNTSETSLAEPLLRQQESISEESDTDGGEPQPESATTITSAGSNSNSSILRQGPLFWFLSLSCLVVYGCILPFNNVASAILLERNYFKKPPEDCTLRFPHECTLGTLQDHPNPSTDSSGKSCPGKHFSPVLPTSLNITRIFYAYHKEVLSDVEVDCDVSFWRDGCTKDYCDSLHQATVTADRVMSIPYIVSAVLSPILGGIVDRVGQRAVFALVAPLVLIIVHVTLALGHSSPFLPLLGQGIAYSLFGAVLWPSVPLAVDPSMKGTAFGIINSIQNIGLVAFPLVVAAIHNQSNRQYLPFVELFFVGCATMGVLVGVQLNLCDRKGGNKLNSVDGKGYPPIEEPLALSENEDHFQEPLTST